MLNAAPRSFLRLLTIVLLFTCGNAFAGGGPSPERTASEFYRWYLGELSSNGDPLICEPARIRDYVSPQLISELQRRYQRNRRHADYFLQAQDIQYDWPSKVRVLRSAVRGNLASAVVSLGADMQTRQKLTLLLAREGGLWKVRMVRLG